MGLRSLRQEVGLLMSAAMLGTVAYFLNSSEDKEDSYRWQASINLGVNGGNQGFSLGEYMTAYKNQMKQWFASYLVEEEEKKSINGHEADIISGTFDKDGHKFRNVQLFMIEKDNAYSVSGVVLASTWRQYKDVLSASVESFVLLSN